MKCQGNKHIKRQSDGKSEGEMQWPCSTALKSVLKGDAGGMCGGVFGWSDMMFAHCVWSFFCGKTDYQITTRSFSSNISVNIQT